MNRHDKDTAPKEANLKLRYSLGELIIGVTPSEAHETSAEVDWGPDVGQEILTD